MAEGDDFQKGPLASPASEPPGANNCVDPWAQPQTRGVKLPGGALGGLRLALSDGRHLHRSFGVSKTRAESRFCLLDAGDLGRGRKPLSAWTLSGNNRTF